MSTVPRPSARKRTRAAPPRSVWLVVVLAAAGLLLTPIVYYLIGHVLYGHRPSWRVGQGEGFRVYLVAAYAAPAAAIYWGLAGAWIRRPRDPAGRWLAAIALYIALGFVLHLAADSGES